MIETQIVGSATRSNSSQSNPINTMPGGGSAAIGIGERARFILSCTNATGSNPTLDVDLVAVVNGVETTLASFQQLTAAGEEHIVIPACPETIRAVWTIGGTTPAFTFSLNCVR